MFEAYAQTPDAGPAADQMPDTLGKAVQRDPGVILDKIQSWAEGFQRLLPNLGVAMVLLLAFAGVGWTVQRALRRWGERHDRANLGAVLGSFLK